MDVVSKTSSSRTSDPSTSLSGLQIKNLCVSFQANKTHVKALEKVSFDISPGEIVGLVGESGSGKTLTALSVMRLLPPPPACLTKGFVFFDKKNILTASQKELKALRGIRIAMIPQDPSSALNPVFTVGSQIAEMFRLHMGINRKQAAHQAVEILKSTGIEDAHKRFLQFPHELSAGQKQRVLTAMAIACRPEVLLADEPTSSLDVTVQARILELIAKLKEQLGFCALFITHDLSLVDPLCSRLVVLYGGQVVEEAPTKEILLEPAHHYTKGLLTCIPGEFSFHKTESLKSIPGKQPNPDHRPVGCIFSPRCPNVRRHCHKEQPVLQSISATRRVRCHFPLV